MRHAHDAGGAIHLGAIKIVVARFGCRAVQTAADAQRQAGGCSCIGQRVLQLQHRQQGLQRLLEDGVDAVARAFDDAPTVRLHGASVECVVPGQRGTHQVGLLLPQAGAALDVGEQETDGGRGGSGHVFFLSSRTGGHIVQSNHGHGRGGIGVVAWAWWHRRGGMGVVASGWHLGGRSGWWARQRPPGSTTVNTPHG